MEGQEVAGDAATAAGVGAAAVHEHPSEWGGLTNDEREDVIARLIQQRGMTEKSARAVVTNGKCEECTCAFGTEVTEDACMCSCHCLCCCAPLFRCQQECVCSCECHYEAIPDSDSGEESENESDDSNDEETERDSLVSATPSEDAGEQTDRGDSLMASVGENPGIAEQSGPNSHGDTAEPSGTAANGVTAGEASTAAAEPGENTHTNQQALNYSTSTHGGSQPPGQESKRKAQGSSARPAADQSDEDMMKAPALPTTLDDRTTGQIYHLFQEQLQASADSAHDNCLRIVAELFERTYKEAILPGQAKQKPNKLPQLTQEEVRLLNTLVTAVIRQKKFTFQRVLGLLKELALASVKSKWSFSNILKDRIDSAKEEKSTPANEWTQRAATQANKVSTELQEAFRFDPRVFAEEDANELREICSQHHVFPTTRREPTPNEWRIIVGMMDGTIIHKALPTFLKRCCDARQMAWIQTQIRDRAEGEIWARLPPSFVVYDHNQTSKRIIGQIRRDATRLKWPDDKLFRVLGLVKAAAYDKTKHSIHLFFFTKMDAALADGIVMPYRNAKLTMRNPDDELPQSGLDDDSMAGTRRVRDGLVNDRYQAFHKARFTNLTRTMNVEALTEYLAKLTDNAIKIGIPLDAYGPDSDWSQTWDFYATTPQCPKALEAINRIIWDGHHIWLLHNPGQQAPPCHQCAQLGHQAAACTTPEADWINEHTLEVTTAELSACSTTDVGQTAEVNDWEHFLRLGNRGAVAPGQDRTEHQSGQSNAERRDNKGTDADAQGSQDSATNQREDNDQSTSTGTQSHEANTVANQDTTNDDATKTTAKEPEEHDKTGAGTAEGTPQDSKKAQGPEWITVGGKASAKQSGQSRPKHGHGIDNKDLLTPSTTKKGTRTTISSLGNVIVITDEDTTKDTNASTTTEETKSDTADTSAQVLSGTTADKASKHAKPKKQKQHNNTTQNHGSKTKSRQNQYSHQETEEEAIQSAIREVQLQRITDQLTATVAKHADTYNRTHLIKKIDGALEHVTTKASKRWILNAIDGLLTKTPETGNCQYHASTEAAFQRDILQEDDEKQTVMVHHTILQKYALQVASEVIPGGEQIGTNLSALVDGAPETADGSRTETPATRWHEYYKDIALSKSGVRDVLEPRLWGGHDSQRTLAMVRRRPVFNIREVDSRTAYVQYYYPWKTAAGTLTAKQAQPGLEEWLKAIKEDAERHHTAPIVLVLTGQHYQAVLFDKQRRVRDTKPTPTLKSPTLLDLWSSLPTVDELIAARRKTTPAKTTADDGHTREELLLSNPQLERSDLIEVLGQSNWSTRDKEEVVSILVSGATNINELLTFTTENEAEDHHQGALMSAEEMELSDSSFESPTQSSAPTTSQVESAEGNPHLSQTSTQSSQTFQTSTGQAYQQHADEMWSGVQREWREQYPGEIPPDLVDYGRLAHWAKHKSGLLLEAGRWATNPFTLLEHLKVADIKLCVEELRQEYLVTQLTEVVETVADMQVRNELREWLHAVNQQDNVNIRRGQLRNETRWAQLRTHAARFINGPTALPFVKKEYSPTCAYVFALDALFPDIPKLAFQSSTSVTLPPVVRMTDAFQYVPDFRSAFEKAVSMKSWRPIQVYFEFLLANRDAEVLRYDEDEQRKNEKKRTVLQELNVAQWVTSFYNPEQHDKKTKNTNPKYSTRSTSGILTQNVRGFRDLKDNRNLWMAGWKRLLGGKMIQMILIQETHVASPAEALELEKAWCRLWGKSWRPEIGLSHWSTSGERTGGVAILLHPSVANQYKRVETELEGDRAMVVESSTRRVINLYAPNDHGAREPFFATLERWIKTDLELLVAGDFNCVLQREKDRFTNGAWREEGTESPTLSEIVQTTGIVDARHVHEDRAKSPTLERLTYWADRSGARLDRSYISANLRGWVVATEEVVPWRQTDHRGVVTWLRDPICKELLRPLAANLYPIRGRSAEQLETALGVELRRVMIHAERTRQPWDDQLEAIAQALRKVRRKEQQRATRQRKRREARQRRRIETFSDLIRYVEEREERRALAKHGNFLLTQSGNSAQVLKRLSHREGTMPITLTADEEDNQEQTDADIMMHAWRTLFERGHASLDVTKHQDACNGFFNVPPDVTISSDDNALLLRAITEEEVTTAMTTLGSMKAAGDDRLSNDFYRDWHEVLAPTFTAECNRLLQGEEMPPSFSRAIIVPIYKGGDRTNALNYRPISLLQSSYKIYTKILAERVQHSLPKVINDDQNGFVRGRAMANNVTLLRALLEQDYDVSSTKSDDCPAIILLDFKKAYDTLDRGFVLHALRTFGYAEEFVQLVENIHKNTTASFLVNGDLSDQFAIVSGIRQGCPLAPLLFLLAAEMLKHAIDNDDRLQGITLRGQEHDYIHTFSAFVDDSVVFLQAGSMVTALHDVLQRFGDFSGLRVQPQKSHAIVLNRMCTDSQLGPFPVVSVGATVPYLGVEMGLAPLNEINWTKRVDKIETTLGILSKHTTCVPDRVAVINLTCTASLLFTAQFFTPPPRTLQRLDSIFRQYVWHGTITTNPRKCHKIDRDIMVLPLKMGGLGLCDYRGAILHQAAKTILRWNSSPNGKYWEAMRGIVAAQTGAHASTCTWTHPSTRRYSNTKSLGCTDNMLAIGLQLTRTAMGIAQSQPADLIKKKSEALQSMTAPEQGLRWITSSKGQITIRQHGRASWTQLRQETYASMPAEIRTFWDEFPWWENEWIRDSEGRSVRRQDFPTIAISTVQELRLHEVTLGTFEFHNPSASSSRKTAASNRVLARWLSIIVLSAGALATDPAGINKERVYGWTRDDTFDRYEWRASRGGGLVGQAIDQKWEGRLPENTDTIMARHIAWGQPIRFEAAHGSTRVIEDLDRLREHSAIVLHGHPLLQRGPTLPVPLLKNDMASTLRKRMADQHIRPLLTKTSQGLEKLIRRLQTVRQRNNDFGTALQLVPLSTLHKKTWGTTAQQHFLWYRMTIGALPVRDNVGELPACPFEFCPGAAAADLEHIMWSCAGAKRAWAGLYRSWTGKAARPASDRLLQHVAQKTAPQLAHTVRAALHTETTQNGKITQCENRGWRVACEAIAQSLWLQRNAAVFERETPNVFEHAGKAMNAALKQIRALSNQLRTAENTRDAGRLLSTLAQQLNEPKEDAGERTVEARLYFDGGSRGNPGATGTGSVLVERATKEEEWTVVWWNAHFLGDDSTNNAAEHEALRRGVTACAARYRNQKAHVVIVGDSQLILRQVEGRNATTTHPMEHATTRTRQALRRLESYEMRHTLRNGNMMADFLANTAMDQRSATTGPTGPDQTTNRIYDLLQGDLTHPTTDIRPHHDILETLQQQLELHRLQHPPASRKRSTPAPSPTLNAQRVRRRTS